MRDGRSRETACAPDIIPTRSLIQRVARIRDLLGAASDIRRAKSGRYRAKFAEREEQKPAWLRRNIPRLFLPLYHDHRLQTD